MAMIGYDPARMTSLHGATQRAIGDLVGVASPDPVAAGAMAVVRSVRDALEQDWLPMIERVLASDAMVSSATAGLHPFASLSVLGMTRAFEGAATGSATDGALVVLVSRFGELDTDGDGELSHDELRAGAHGADDELRAACSHLLDRPLALVNVALSPERFAWHEGTDDIDLDDIRISPSMLATALAQNRAIRVVADPVLFASLDKAVNGEIDGRVSKGDVRAWLEHESDPHVRGALEYLLDEELLGRLDRENPFGDSDGRFAYDQVYALGVHQGAFDGLPDPTIPPALRDHFGPPEDTGERTPQFLHATITPEPGMGQVMIALYVPTPITTDFGDVAYLVQRFPFAVDDTNRALIDRLANDRTTIRFGVLNTDKRFVAPRIDARFEVWTNPDGTVGLEWHRDAFPSMEAYHIYPDGQITLIATEEASHNADRGLLPLWWTNTHGTGEG